MIDIKYTYTLEWSSEDNAYICRCEGYTSLGTHGDTPMEALTEMIKVIKEIELWEKEGISG